MIKHSMLDKVGAGASFLCAIHCSILPVAVSLLPIIGLSWLADENIERCFLAISAFLGIFSLCWGFSVHRKMHALAVLATGIGLMAVGHIAEDTTWGVVVAVAGGLSIATSHLINHKLCTTCHTCGEC